MAFASTDEYQFQSGDFFLGLDEHNQEIGIRSPRHAVTIAGSRSGKGACVIIPNLMRWPHNVLCIDPKGENAERTFEKREEMGQAVYVLDPFHEADIPDRIRARFNPLMSIDLASSRARVAINAIASGLVVVHDPKHMEWVSGARSMLAGIIAYVVAEAPPEHRSFASVRNILMQPAQLPESENDEPQGLYADAQMMAQDERAGGLIRSAGLAIMTAIETDKGMEKDFLGLARRSTEWLDDEYIAASLSYSTFDLTELKQGNASVYLVLPADSSFIETYGAFLRLFVETSLTAMGTGKSDKKCLFILDEFYSLGKLEKLSTASGRMPSDGVHLWPILQDLGQGIQLYGREGFETFFANADLHQFFGNTDKTTLDRISYSLGVNGINDVPMPPPPPSMTGGGPSVVQALTANDQGTRTMGAFFGSMSASIDASYNASEQKRYQQEMNEYNHAMQAVGKPIFTAQEVAQMVERKNDVVADNMICFVFGQNALKIKPAPYFRKIEAPKEPEIKAKPKIKLLGVADEWAINAIKKGWDRLKN